MLNTYVFSCLYVYLFYIDFLEMLRSSILLNINKENEKLFILFLFSLQSDYILNLS